MDKKYKVMIVEDDDSITQVYNFKLKAEGIDSIVAKDGEEAVAKVISEKPDLILLDLMLPKKDGFWVLEQVRKNPASMVTPIIVISNIWEQSDKEKALVLGANEFLVKVDVSIPQIIEKIKENLK